MSSNAVWPTSLSVTNEGRSLRINFSSSSTYIISAELLRVESPSAEVKGHGPGQEQLVFGKQNVSIRAVEPVGNYAVRLKFSDGHDTGIFTWPYLQKLGETASDIWADYLRKLDQSGHKRF